MREAQCTPAGSAGTNYNVPNFHRIIVFETLFLVVFALAELVLKRHDSLPVSTMWQWWVSTAVFMLS
ncbi:hypothetical protein QF001_004979 [Paraburkholderia youngii]|uniref:hypothetical protein n=1 Tax=Paraburkholderia youngii TaxID=2782701 RepID=UPI003D200DE8